MAVIHHTTLKPSKVELLASWLPGRPWYRGAAGSTAPVLVKSGGFRLDDPEGEVGIEFIVVTDTSGSEPVAYLAPLTYRGAPLDGAAHALIGTLEHGVLGTRWVYDGCQDPVLVAEVLSLFEGRAQAMSQSLTDTVDQDVIRSYTGAPFAPNGFAPAPTDDRDSTRLATPHGTTLHVHRVLSPAPAERLPLPEGDDVIGYIARGWTTPWGDEVAAVFMTLHAA